MTYNFVGAQSNELIHKSSLAKELGVSSRTLSRWMEDRDIGFPPPVVIRTRNYFNRADVEAWRADRVRASVRIASPDHMRAA